MNAVNNVTNNNEHKILFADENKKENLISLFKEKVEESIKNNSLIIMTISYLCMECRNTFYIEGFEYADDYLFLSNNDFELHINLNDIEITYDNTCIDIEDLFTFTYNDIGIKLYFIAV